MSGSDVEALSRDVRRLKLYAVAVTVLLGALGMAALKPSGAVERFERIEAERIDIVGADGTRRVVLSNQERFPPPVLDGEEFERSIDPAGFVLYDRDGDEMGGLGAVDVEDGGRRALFILDYRNSDAIGFGAGGSADGDSYSAGLTIADRVPLEDDIREVGSAGTRRIRIGNADGDAAIHLADPDGNTRIRLYVNANGTAGVELLDREGEVVSRLGPEGDG